MIIVVKEAQLTDNRKKIFILYKIYQNYMLKLYAYMKSKCVILGVKEIGNLIKMTEDI